MSSKIKSKNKTFILLIDGPMGAGKTTVAKILHQKLKRTAWLALDRIKWYISDFKRAPRDNNISRNVELVMMEEYIKQGINVIVEQAMTLRHINAFREISKKYDTNFFMYQLNAPKNILIKRVFERANLLGKSKPSKILFEKNYKLQLNSKDKNAIVLNSEKLSPEEIVKIILKEIKN